MDKDSFIVYIKAKDIYNNISEDFGKRLNTSNYELDRSLMKVELGRPLVKDESCCITLTNWEQKHITI